MTGHKPIRTLPDRMVALSLLPPPSANAAPAPFGYGAFVIEPKHRRGEAAFSLHAHGFAAGYPPDRMQRELGQLFDPDTTGLIYAPAPPGLRRAELAAWPFPSQYLYHIPRSGLRRNVFVPLEQDLLHHAGRIARLDLPLHAPSPLGRLARIGDEAQAAWVFWVLERVRSRQKRELLASFAAWKQLRQAGLVKP